MLSILLGLVSLAAGVWGFMTFFNEFIFCVKGIFFPSLAFVGLISVIAGVSSILEVKKETKQLSGSDDSK